MSKLKDKFKSKLKENELMKNHTSFKIGGPARYFLEVKSGEELIEAVDLAENEDLNYAVVGRGSNLLVSDQGFSGLIVKMSNSKCQMINDKSMIVGAGASLEALSKFAMNNSLTGMEWAMGVPGTTGGAIVMNAGCFQNEMKDSVVWVKYFDGKNVKKIKKRKCKFGYRESVFGEHLDWIVLAAELKLKKGDKAKIKKKVQEYLDQRNQKLPNEPSAGSIFKKYKIEKGEKLREKLERIFEKEHPEFLKQGYIPAGWLIEEAGLKGKLIGGAQVSEKHAGFIVNTGGATAEQVIMLISLIKQKVRNEFGAQLQEEVMYLGF